MARVAEAAPAGPGFVHMTILLQHQVEVEHITVLQYNVMKYCLMQLYLLVLAVG